MILGKNPQVRTHSIEEGKRRCREIDQENVDTIWWEAIMQGMKNVRLAFEVWGK